jgi:lipoprotein-anchoring transpeptidase ErfK/SrfK
VGTAAVAVLPWVRPGQEPAQAAATPGASTLERASLSALSRPVSAEIAAKSTETSALLKKTEEAALRAKESAKLPAGSGVGRRVVFSESAQRVWLVGSGGAVQRTYLVSGSKFDNLEPGTYAVQSRTRQATAFDGSGTMEYFVRFATGFTAPIGFHTVPVDNAGRLEQTKAQLGTPLSAGCVRQWRDDALVLWTFAPIGTKVVVTA